MTLTTPLNSARHREEDKGRFALNTSHLGHLSLFLSLSHTNTHRFAKEIELGRVELQSYSDESSLGWEAESKRNQTSFGSAAKTKHGEVERKKGTPWTGEEHKDMEEMVSKKQMAEELAKLRREMLELLSRKQNGESQAIVVSNPSATNQKLDLHTSLLVPFKSDLDSSFITLVGNQRIKSNFRCIYQERHSVVLKKRKRKWEKMANNRKWEQKELIIRAKQTQQ